MNSIKKASNSIINSKYLIALTGAGVSSESGIPTFRGKNGLWKQYKADELATPEAFKKNPKLVWQWYSWRISIVLSAKPNPAHYSLAYLEKIGILKALITQNVDDLHERAGSKNVIKLHGDILTVKCPSCGYEHRIWKPPQIIPPKCPRCRSIMRPGVVWFGERIPPDIIDKALSEAEKADVILVIGTSGVVMPAGAIPEIVKRNGGKVIEINIERTAISPIADIFIKGKAGEVLPKIVEEINRKRGLRNV